MKAFCVVAPFFKFFLGVNLGSRLHDEEKSVGLKSSPERQKWSRVSIFAALLVIRSPSPRLPSPGEEVRAEFFMEELNNGVKLCELIGALQTKVAQSCPSALCKVSRAAQSVTGPG